MKRLILSMFLTIMLLAPGMAKADVGISDNDLAAVFNESVAGNELVASALSLQEMEETEGARFKFVANILRNTKFDGPKGGRVVQIRYKTQPVFRIDNHPNPYTSNVHMHFGNMKLHRPWYSPWSGK